VIRRARPLLGTFVEIAACARDAERERRAVAAAFDAVAQVHGRMSFHAPSSDLARLNRRAHLEPVAVAPDTFAVLERAAFFAAESDGLFDCTVGAVLVRAGRLPAHPGSATGAGTWRDVELLPDRRVRFARPLALDLGGIAKGWAVDRAIEALERHGVRSGLVNAGGDLRATGERAWPLAIRLPGARAQAIRLAPLRGEAVATTAFARGAAASRVVDPRTGAIRRAARSVSVFAPRCIDADALTKIAWLGPPPEALLERLGARVLELRAPRARTGLAAA
jgi:thiamine biosynthesis lipoprotein